MRRLAPALMFLACAGGLTYSAISFKPPEPKTKKPVAAVVAAAPAPTLSIVRGRVSSDKIALMNDPVLKAAFAASGMSLSLGVTPGREMIVTPDARSQYVFSWPTDDETASMIAQGIPQNPWVRAAQAPFYTSPVLLAWGPAADILTKGGIVHGQGRWRTVDMRALVAGMTAGKRWSDVGRNAAWTSDRLLQVRMPDLDRSGTTTMFLAIVSQIANGGRNVATIAEAKEVAGRLIPLFRGQGSQPGTVAQAITEFTAFGISRTPLMLASEADAVQLLATSPRAADVVVLYPDQTVVSPQVFVPYTLTGAKVARVLQRADVRNAAIRHGFRVVGIDRVPGPWPQEQGPPRNFSTILEMPGTDMVETMIARIDGRQEEADAQKAETESERQVEPEVQRAPVQQPVGTSDIAEGREAGDERPPVRPVIDPSGDAESQQIRVQDYVRQLQAYRQRQAARAATVKGNDQ